MSFGINRLLQILFEVEEISKQSSILSHVL